MESDDLAPHIPRKRSRSPSVLSVSLDASSRVSVTVNDNARPPAPKRLRRSHDVPDYHAPMDEHVRKAMAGANPLNRRVLKREAKKARRAANRASQGQSRALGMEVDDDAGLAATFMS